MTVNIENETIYEDIFLTIVPFRYHWRQFAVVTSDIAGHDDFVQAVREEVGRMREELSIK